ncbi:MAG: cytochrome b/b6 domain-containing protein [Mariprofundus sp.]|nr:cytochrome b/b6 domain-containing protein [Mariprofundus sp.]
MIYATPIRILHSLLALCMIAQLAVGELMDVPGAAEEEPVALIQMITPALAHGGAHHADSTLVIVKETLGFEVHQYLGLTIAALLLMRLLLAFTSLPGAGGRNLFPWLSGMGMASLISESKAQLGGWLKGRLAAPEEGETVAKAVHGLMLLTAFSIAVAGVVLYFGWNALGEQTAFIETVGAIHETLVGLLEGLLGLHILAVIIHQRMGHNILARIKPGG